ncbi:MAG: HEPN domain-containing protein [Candidatus Diapherotrites archaeon]
MIEFNECIEKGLLRKVPGSKEKALQSIEMTKELLQEATENFEEKRINSTVIISYLAMFHAARAILFKDGFREKSHECLIKYLEEKHPEINSAFIEKLEKYKNERNKTQYDITHRPTEEDAEEMLEFAEKFTEKIEELLESTPTEQGKDTKI